MKYNLKTAVSAFALAVFAQGASAQEEIKLTVAAGHPPVVDWVNMLDGMFIPEVDRRLAETGAYKIDWTTGYAGSIAKIGGEIDALEDGIADIAIVGASFNPDRLPLQTVSYYTPFASSDLGVVVRAVDHLNRTHPDMVAAWGHNDMTYLAGIGVDTFQLYTSIKATDYHALDGRKVGGIGPNLSWLINGMTGVAVQPASAYTDLQTGVYEGALVSDTLGLTLRVNEVAPYRFEMNFGAMSFGALAMNADVFEDLPEEVQTVIREVGVEYQAALIDFTTAKASENLATMEANGLTSIPVSAEDRQACAIAVPNIAKAWAETHEANGLPGSEIVAAYLEAIEANGGTPARDWSAE